ncbi:MAG: D-alanyl-D-alanine carboxypeptidase, partial [Bauldia sp.]|nr:D-alanyl-D-alanine carboxypeptidase [Bauldia sp.]
MRRRSGLLEQGLNWGRLLLVVCLTALAVGTAGAAAEAATSAAIVVDAKSGKVLYSSNADARCYPASLTKMMTLYMLFEALDSGKVTLSSRITISKHAAAQPPSKLGLKPGQTIAVKDAILALVTRSANDIAAAIGERLGGTESGFASKMTAKARAIGMKSTTFRNASGLPDPAQITTARDMALLGRALQDRFPKYFAYFKTPSFTYGGRKIGNHNRLLGRVAGVDGIKT